jgi:hypothetical protein
LYRPGTPHSGATYAQKAHDPACQKNSHGPSTPKVNKQEDKNNKRINTHRLQNNEEQTKEKKEPSPQEKQYSR